MMAMDWEFVNASSIFFRMRALARSTSSCVGGSFGKAFNSLQQNLLRIIDGLLWLELHIGQRHSGIVLVFGAHAGGNGFLAVDELPCRGGLSAAHQAPGPSPRAEPCQDEGCRNVINRDDALNISHAAQQSRSARLPAWAPLCTAA